MWAWTDRIGILLFDAAFAAAVFLTLILLAILVCRQPARRILLARVALLASLGIPPLVAWGHLPRLNVIDTFVESRFFPRALVEAAAALESPRESDSSDGSGLPVLVFPDWIIEREDAALQWLPRGLTIMDLICVAVGGAWLILGIAGVHWLIFRSHPASTEALAMLDALLEGRSWDGPRPGLKVCARLRHPVVTGLVRPMILIPESLDRPVDHPEPLRLSLLHELAHVERSDHWFSTAASLAQAIWFFLPQIWWIRAQLLIDQEFLADRAAADRYGTSSDYASSLLLIVTGEREAPTTSPGPPERARAVETEASSASLGEEGPSPLFQRMMMLLNCPYPVEARTPRVWSWTSRFVVVSTSILAACLVIRWPHPSLADSTPAVSQSPRPRFKSTHFLAEPLSEPDGRWRPRIYVLPVMLPSRFDLEVEVRCARSGPEQIRVIGLSITIPPLSIVEDPFEEPTEAIDDEPAWHQVHIHRDGPEVSIFLDDHLIPDDHPPGPTPACLTIQSPLDSPAEFRNLVISW